MAESARQRSLDDPAFRKHEEAMRFAPDGSPASRCRGLGDGGRGLRTLVRGINENTLDEGEEAAGAPFTSVVSYLQRFQEIAQRNQGVHCRILFLRQIRSVFGTETSKLAHDGQHAVAKAILIWR
jgi:hypothetical protein